MSTRGRFIVTVALFMAGVTQVGAGETWIPVWQLNPGIHEGDTDFQRWQRVIRGQEDDGSVYDEPLATDRPDFTETSSVVGRGVLQIETGYTYIGDDENGTSTRAHSLPESLFRYGISDSIELRLVWNYFWTHTEGPGVNEDEDGAEDLVLGAKFALTSESGWIPATALILDFTTPTGGSGVGHEHADFGSNFLFSWELPGDRSFGGSFGYSTASELTTNALIPPTLFADRYSVFSTSLAYGIPLADPWGVYFEYFGLYFHGLDGGSAENYFNTGLTYLLNNDVQFDVRVGAGLDSAADDFFTGAGVSVRL